MYFKIVWKSFTARATKSLLILSKEVGIGSCHVMLVSVINFTRNNINLQAASYLLEAKHVLKRKFFPALRTSGFLREKPSFPRRMYLFLHGSQKSLYLETPQKFTEKRIHMLAINGSV